MKETGPETEPAGTAANSGWKRAWRSQDVWITIALFMVTVLSRLPFRTSLLYSWDSILYARALDHFDVTLQQPQPPGHIYYVALVWLVDQLAGDPNAAMVWISVFSSAVAVAALFWLGLTMFGRRAGLLAALLLATSLSFWTHSEVALPYALLGLLSVVVAAVIYQTWQGKKGYVLPAALVLGLASGFRQDLLFFLLPLFAIGLRGVPLRGIIKAVLVLLAAILSWYVPSALFSGGFTSYYEASSAQSSFLITSSSVIGNDGLAALSSNVTTLGHFFFWAAAGTLPLIGALTVILPLRWSRFKNRRLLFLAVWALPSIAFYIFIHIGEPGYVFSFLPPVLLATAWGTDEAISWFTSRARGGRRGLIYFAPALLIVLNLLLFLFLSPKMSASSLDCRDEVLGSTIETIKDNFDPASTLILAVHDDQHVSYYLPEYRHLKLDAMRKENVSAQLSPDIKQVVIFDKYLSPAPGAPVESLPLAGKKRLNYIPRKPGQRSVFIDYNSMTVTLEK